MAGLTESPTLVRLPYAPRPLQRVIHAALDAHRFAAVVCHRRFGKTVLAANHLIRAAMRSGLERPRFAYIAPTYRMGKAIAWDYLKHYTSPIDGVSVNESELRIDFPLNGAQVRIYGADNPDALRGIYLDGCVLDEYGLMDGTVFTEVVRPLLTDRKGWAVFLGTPNGKNQFYEIVQTAKQSAGWFFAEYKASETHLLDPDELAAAREVMTEDEYHQEFEASFEASVKGAVYAREVAAAREAGRITRVPYDPALLVSTDWDLGMDDATAIVYSQVTPSGEIRVIDYDEGTGKGLDYYAKLLKEKPYVYDTHHAPHDIAVRELSSARTRLDLARGLGINFNVSPRVGNVSERIYAARSIFPLVYMDADKCARLIEALQHYRWKAQGTDATGNALTVHDWACVTGDTKVLTRHGTYQIQYLPEKGEVLTLCGWKRYENPRITRRSAPLVEVVFSDGLTVRCTPEHRFLTESGWTFASDLLTGSLIQSSWTRSRSISLALSTASGRVSAITRVAVRACIEMSGLRRLASSLTDAISTIATGIQGTTPYRILNAYPSGTISRASGRSTRPVRGITLPLPRDPALLSGTRRTWGVSGTAAMPRVPSHGLSGSVSLSPASTAAPRWTRLFASLVILKSIALTPARRLRIASVRPLQGVREDVWCLTVPDGAQWSLANGAITHNSHAADAFGGMAYRNPRTSRKAEALVGAALRKAQRDTDPFTWETRRAGRGGY